MELHTMPASVKGSAERFTGDVWMDMIAEGDGPSRVRVAAVRFAPRSRTAWHSHVMGQTLYVTDGVGYVQSRGGELTEIRPGDVIRTSAGEWHWHGAAADHFMSHIAIWEAAADGSETAWGHHVTDADYPDA